MAISYQLLEWLLRKEYKISHLPRYSPYLSFSDMFFWDGKKPLPDVLYFKSHTSMVLNMEPDEYPALHILEEELLPVFDGQAGMLITCPAGEVPTTINRISHIVGEYNKWYYDALFASTKAFQPQSFVDIWDSYFDLPLSVVDASYLVVAQSNNITQLFPGSHPIPVGTRFDFQRIAALTKDDWDYEKSFTEKGLRRYIKDDNKKRHRYYYNLFVHKQYAARLLISVPEADDLPGIEQLLSDCGDLITDNYARYLESKYVFENKNSLSENLEKLLNNENVSSEEMSAAAEELGWLPEHRLRILYLTVDRIVQSTIGLSYFCEAAERTLPCSIALDRKDHVFVLVNETKLPPSLDFEAALELLLQENHLHAGVSVSFVGLFKAKNYDYQANQALLLGKRNRPDTRFYYFNSFTLEYALAEIVRKVPGVDQCCPTIQALQDYDRLHSGSELNKTLYTFLKLNGNATAAADALYIHRTTFLYRMSKIQQLVGEIDLNDWDTKLRLMLSYSLNPVDRDQSPISEKVNI